MNCDSCGRANRPFEARCTACGRRVQDEVSAHAWRRRWEATPPPLRAEVEREIEGDLRQAAAHDGWLRERRTATIALGAILLPLAALIGGLEAALLPLDALLGAVAAWRLHADRGGAKRGLAYFLATYAVHFLLVLRAGGGSPAADLIGFGAGALAACAVGWMAGAWLDERHVARTFA